MFIGPCWLTSWANMARVCVYTDLPGLSHWHTWASTEQLSPAVLWVKSTLEKTELTHCRTPSFYLFICNMSSIGKNWLSTFFSVSTAGPHCGVDFFFPVFKSKLSNAPLWFCTWHRIAHWAELCPNSGWFLLELPVLKVYALISLYSGTRANVQCQHGSCSSTVDEPLVAFCWSVLL